MNIMINNCPPILVPHIVTRHAEGMVHGPHPSFIHLVVMTTWNTYDMLDLKLNLLRYYRLLTDEFIKQKISSLNSLEGLFVK